MRLPTLAAAAAMLLAAPALPAAGDSPPADGPPIYVALGDSLAASVQPDADGHDHATRDGYAEMVWQARARLSPGLELVKLGRGGETAASMVKSSKPGPSQLELAEEQLHAGRAALVTLDIGANEVEACRRGSTFERRCVDNGLAAIRRNLPRIVRRLRAAGGGDLRIVGINYYNSFLGQWVTGPEGKELALASVPVERSINAVLARVYRQVHVPVADVETRFATQALNRYVRTEAFGRVPLAVERACRWTWACSERYDDHTNTLGYRVITRTVLGALRRSNP